MKERTRLRKTFMKSYLHHHTEQSTVFLDLLKAIQALFLLKFFYTFNYKICNTKLNNQY